MFSASILESPLLKIIANFVCGDIDITEFMEKYDHNDDLANYLDSIIDYITIHNIPIKRRTVLMKNVNQNKPFEMR